MTVRGWLRRYHAIQGRIEIRPDGVYYTPAQWQRRWMRLRPHLAISWDDVVAVTVRPRPPFKQWVHVRTTSGAWQSIGVTNFGRRITAELEAIGFAGHTRADDPDVWLFTRPPTEPDWSWLP